MNTRALSLPSLSLSPEPSTDDVGIKPSPLILTGYVLVLVMMVLGPYMSFGVAPFTGEGNPMRQLIYVVALVLVVLGMQPWRYGIAKLAVPFHVLIILGWCYLSLTWSIAPAIGLRRLLLTTIVMLLILYSVRELKVQTSLSWLRIILFLTLIANWFTVIAFPQIGIHQFDPAGDSGIVGSWCGMMLHKNFAGAACAMTILVYALGYSPRKRSNWIRAFTIVLAAGFLWGTQSKTSAGIAAIALLCGLLYRAYNPRYRALMIPVAIIASVTVVFFINLFWRDVVAPLYDPHAFTGRTQIWPALFTYMRDHPMGAGFGSFWNIGVGQSPMFHYSRGWMAELGNGHNGYLDLAVSIGLPGLVLALICLFVWPIAKLFASVTMSKGQGALALSLILFSVGHNFTESTLLDRDATVQIMLMLGIAVIELTTRSQRELERHARA